MLAGGREATSASDARPRVSATAGAGRAAEIQAALLPPRRTTSTCADGEPAPPRGLAEPAVRDRAFADRPARMERGAAPGPAEQKVRTPEEWLEDIRRLKALGRLDEFDKELAEFRKRYPDYKLPADLAK
jgi:hypothetical protein